MDLPIKFRDLQEGTAQAGRFLSEMLEGKEGREGEKGEEKESLLPCMTL